MLVERAWFLHCRDGIEETFEQGRLTGVLNLNRVHVIDDIELVSHVAPKVKYSLFGRFFYKLDLIVHLLHHVLIIAPEQSCGLLGLC